MKLSGLAVEGHVLGFSDCLFFGLSKLKYWIGLLSYLSFILADGPHQRPPADPLPPGNYT
jgi:hypothetical protein